MSKNDYYCDYTIACMSGTIHFEFIKTEVAPMIIGDQQNDMTSYRQALGINQVYIIIN